MLELVIRVSVGPKGANNTSREEISVSLTWFGSGLEPLWIIVNKNSPFASSLVSSGKDSPAEIASRGLRNRGKKKSDKN